MRLALVVYGSLGQRSGGYLYDRMLVRSLRDAGDEVAVVGIPRRPYSVALLDNFRRLPRRLARLAPDVVLEDELCHPSLCWTNRAIVSTIGCPVVSIVHHLRVSERPHDWLGRVIERRYLETVDAVIANSMTTAATVGHMLGRVPRSIVAAPGRDRLGALSTDQVRERAAEPGPLQIVTVGNLEQRKNVATLIRALAQLPRGAFRLTVVGAVVDRHYAATLRQLVGALQLAAEVCFLGPVDDVRLASLLARSDVFAQPSWYEGFGIAALEALGFGLPVISSSKGGAVELVDHGENGYLVDPGDLGSLVDALRALADRAHLARMSCAALERYNRQPTWQESFAPVRDFLAAVL